MKTRPPKDRLGLGSGPAVAALSGPSPRRGHSPSVLTPRCFRGAPEPRRVSVEDRGYVGDDDPEEVGNRGQAGSLQGR
jgi:hypothetical protein